jgi:hypothetical protein
MKYLLTLFFLIFVRSLFSETIEMVNSSEEEIYASFRKDFENSSVILGQGVSATEGFSDKDEIGPNILWRNTKEKKVKSFPIDQKYVKAKFTEISFVYLGHDQWCIRIYKSKKSFPIDFQLIINEDKIEAIAINNQFAFTNKNKEWVYTELLIDDIQPQKIGQISSISEHPALVLYFVKPKENLKLIFNKDNKLFEAKLVTKELDFKEGKCFEIIVDGDFVNLNVYKEYYGSRETLILNKKIPIIEKVVQKKEEDIKNEDTHKNEIK